MYLGIQKQSIIKNNIIMLVMTPWKDGYGNTYLWGKPSENYRMEDNEVEYDYENRANIDIEGCDYDDF